MLFVLYFPPPNPVTLPPSLSNLEIRMFYDRLMEECPDCKPIILKKDGTSREMKIKQVIRYLERRRKFYSHHGIDL